MEASRCRLGPHGDRSERGGGWFRFERGGGPKEDSRGPLWKLLRKGRWAQVPEEETDLQPPLHPRRMTPPFSPGERWGAAAAAAPGAGTWCSVSAWETWSFRCELALPSVGLAFAKCFSPAPHAPPRIVINEIGRSLSRGHRSEI